jgi:predicted transcriptional regulator
METKIFKSKYSKLSASSRNRKSIYFNVNKQIVFDANINATSLRVFLSVWSNRDGYSLNQKDLAKRLKMDPSTFNRHLSKLSDYGYVYKCLYSDANNDKFSAKKYNYFFCDVGRANDYYNALLHFGFIDEKGTIKKNIERFSITDFEDFETRKQNVNVHQVNKWAEDYINTQKLTIDTDIRDSILEKIKLLVHDLFETLNFAEKSLHFKSFTKDEITKTKAHARFNLSKEMIERNIDELIKKSKS